jgi:hypothetical protein
MHRIMLIVHFLIEEGRKMPNQQTTTRRQPLDYTQEKLDCWRKTYRLHKCAFGLYSFSSSKDADKAEFLIKTHSKRMQVFFPVLGRRELGLT